MNPQYEQQLEASVRRELNALGVLPAPPALADRILAALEQRTAAPWYRQAWVAWPFALRMTSLTVLVLAFAGLCLGVWELTHGVTGQGRFGGWWAEADALWRTLAILTNTAGRLVGQLGNGVIFIGATIIFVSWVVCIGLGTAYVRLAMRPATN